MSNCVSKEDVIKIIDEFGYVNCYNGKDFEANNRVDKIRQKVIELPNVCDMENIIEQFENKMKAVRSGRYAEDKFQNSSIQTIIVNVISDLEEIIKSATNGRNEDCGKSS